MHPHPPTTRRSRPAAPIEGGRRFSTEGAGRMSWRAAATNTSSVCQLLSCYCYSGNRAGSPSRGAGLAVIGAVSWLRFPRWAPPSMGAHRGEEMIAQSRFQPLSQLDDATNSQPADLTIQGSPRSTQQSDTPANDPATAGNQVSMHLFAERHGVSEHTAMNDKDSWTVVQLFLLKPCL
ncbi:hypothetical protein MTO96_030712 [Rhipicephalus appendiculatus]